MNKRVDMLNGPLLGPVILFALPLMLTSILQLLFNAADIIVIGKFSTQEALAAVGSTGPVINLTVNIFIGISIGASVIMGKYLGARDFENSQLTLHTSILISVIGGFMVMALGYFASGQILAMMNTPEEVLKLATLYLKIYFLGMPGAMVFNFGSSLLRSAGDTRSPLYFLAFSGVVNVVLNLILVIYFKMGVAGVAIATAVSQYVSAALIIISLMKGDQVMKLDLKKLKISWNLVGDMLKIGIPAGLQGALFSISNIMIQSTINSFGSAVMAGNTAAGNIEGFVYMGMNAIYQAALSFTSQNMGAKQYHRIRDIYKTTMLVVTGIGLVMGMGSYFLGNHLLKLYTNDAEVIMYGLERLSVVAFYYALCGLMDVQVGVLRGMGYSISPMIISLIAVCGLRIIWILFAFPLNPTRLMIYWSYPVTWIAAAIPLFILYRRGIKKLDNNIAAEVAR
ncbi:MAG: MATE family efflux transporter [Firmicutes bacterium]|nr:MATE family efflux transporter [Bacillota bacterium]